MTEKLTDKKMYAYKKQVLLRFLGKLQELDKRPVADLERLEFFADHGKSIRLLCNYFAKNRKKAFDNLFAKKSSFNLANQSKKTVVSLNRSFAKETKKYEKKMRRLVSNYFYIFHLTIKRNNVFCILTDNKGNTIFPACSAGSFELSVSKKTLKYTLSQFLRQYKKRLIENDVILSDTVALKLTSPRRYRRLLLREMNNSFFKELSAKNSAVLLEIRQGKPFNGCRGVKLRKKKRFKPFVYKSIV